MERKDITAYVEFMKTKGLDISEGSMTGKQIKAALDLAVVPKLGPKGKKYFYVMQSESLETIKEKYKKVSPDMANDGKRKLITMFAKFLKQLKDDQWHNSIDELPEGKNLPHENMLLLWKLDHGFTEAFYTLPQRRMTPRRTTSPRGKASTILRSRSSSGLASKSKSPVANLSKDFDS